MLYKYRTEQHEETVCTVINQAIESFVFHLKPFYYTHIFPITLV